MKPRELCKAILHDLNCKTEEEEEEGSDRLAFKFQGETFCIIVSDDCLLATIYDFSWGSVELDDIDEVSRVRKSLTKSTSNTAVILCSTLWTRTTTVWWCIQSDRYC